MGTIGRHRNPNESPVHRGGHVSRCRAGDTRRDGATLRRGPGIHQRKCLVSRVISAITPDATATAARIASGEWSSTAAVGAALERIEELEPRIGAWAFVDCAGALSQAAELDAQAASGVLRGPLHGVPVGLKDVFHVRDMPTVANSKTTSLAAQSVDSEVARRLRAAGAVIIGKCETVEFAGMGDPPPTRNPWNTGHTAGGSSSGSGAAVGAGMVPVTMGTQTGGSNLRPAAYCGVAGFKPTHGAISRVGLLPVSWTLDHPGIIARSARDLSLVFGVVGRDAPAPTPSSRPWRVGLVRQFFLERSEPSVVASIRQAMARLQEGGAEVDEVALPPMFDAQQSIHRLIMSPEMVTYHAPRLAEQAERMSTKHAQSVRAFSLLPVPYYLQALACAPRAPRATHRIVQPLRCPRDANDTGSSADGPGVHGRRFAVEPMEPRGVPRRHRTQRSVSGWHADWAAASRQGRGRCWGSRGGRVRGGLAGTTRTALLTELFGISSKTRRAVRLWCPSMTGRVATPP